MTPAVQVSHIHRQFGRVQAVQDVSFSIEPGTLLVLLGASGCGKTTTLRLIAGLETPDSGEISISGVQVSGAGRFVQPEDRRLGMVFQDYALFPHLTAADNIGFALNGAPARERHARITEMLVLVGLAALGDRYPHQLSGGEQQRVALARALAASPGVVLLDEPFSNLDAALRKEMREEVRRILRQTGMTAVFVTHDQEEALSLADQIAVMRGGRLQQIGAPQDVYLRPVNREVAAFLGEANFVHGMASGGQVECALGRLPLWVPRHGPVEVLVRPEQIKLEAVDSPPPNAPCIEHIRYFGHDQIVTLALPGGDSLDCRTWARLDLKVGTPVRLDVHGPVIAYSR
jgi:iron(III) transport system ATP-binding protein